MTGNDIINDALFAAGILGIGQTPGADMTTRALRTLNAMLAQWSAKRWVVYHLVNSTKTMTGALSYTVGPSGDFNLSARPAQLEAVFVSQNLGTPQQIDTPLTLLDSREDYNRVSMKQLTSIPYYAYYDAAFPLGVLYPWPVPNAGLYGLTITVRDVLPQISDPSLSYNIPPEYQEALVYNLAARMQTLYGLDPSPGVVGLAKAALGTIRGNNAQIPTLQMPNGMGGGPRYNIYSDQGR